MVWGHVFYCCYSGFWHSMASVLTLLMFQFWAALWYGWSYNICRRHAIVLEWVDVRTMYSRSCASHVSAMWHHTLSHSNQTEWPDKQQGESITTTSSVPNLLTHFRSGEKAQISLNPRDIKKVNEQPETRMSYVILFSRTTYLSLWRIKRF